MALVAAAKKTDPEIQQDVLRELKWDTRVEETDVGVEVDAGVVTLSGTVSSWGKRHAAAEAAHRVRGVLDVANDIVVKMPGMPGRTDTEVAHAVRNALMWDVFVPDTHIRSTVSDGVVTMDGEVETWTQAEDAERAVRNLAGVRSVMNLISIKPPYVVDAAEDLRHRSLLGGERGRDRSGQGHAGRAPSGRQAADRAVLLAAHLLFEEGALGALVSLLLLASAIAFPGAFA
jgi:osmotically-inducible protein OsmY